MAKHGRAGLVWFALATLVFLLLAGCNGFFPSANLTSISVADSSGSSTPSINVGHTDQMVATGTFDDGSHHTISATWTISPADGSIATITTGGLVTGVKAGTATVTAAAGGVTPGTASVTVCGNITSITISPLSQIDPLGQGTQQFTAKDQGGTDITSSVTWSSSNTAVATISNSSGTNGLATLTGRGTTTIQAASCTVSNSTLLTVN